MISNEMFRRFVLDTIRTDTERLDNVIFHLDGIGDLVSYCYVSEGKSPVQYKTELGF